MQNEQKDVIEVYIPRKCSATNRLLTAKDTASVQIDVGEVDENGKYNGRNKTFALAGFIRQRGEADGCLNRLFHQKNLTSFAK